MGLEGSLDGTLNGTSEVTLVAAPTTGIRRVVKNINIYIKDTAAVTLEIRFKNGGSTRILFKQTLDPDDTYVLGEEDLYVLDTTSKSITVVMSAAITTANPEFVSSYMDNQ
jgi:hypothetical protein